MIPLNSEAALQAPATMADALVSVRGWVGAASSACIVVGSTGAGKSHLLSSVVGDVVDAVIMPPPDGSDCSQFLENLGSGTGQLVVADDLDKFSKGLREEVIQLVGEIQSRTDRLHDRAVRADSRPSPSQLRGRCRRILEGPCLKCRRGPSLYCPLDRFERPNSHKKRNPRMHRVLLC